ncbi:clotting factor C-like [Choristoneura fumiferana]|uniref:clotting factor C-like n=1 Tax=Choristoneura fumiferana TaxID=7141 RepID=UPI003D159635
MEPSYFLFLFSAACGLAVVNAAGCGDQFQCRDGSCVDQRKQCNGQADCVDWSDETMTSCRGVYRPFWNLVLICGNAQVRSTLDDVCPVSCASNPIDCGLHLAALTVQTPVVKPPLAASCAYPRVIAHGRISVNGEIDVVNNTASHGSDLRFSCDEWYDLIGKSKVYCQFGTWSEEFPTCVRSSRDRCILPQYPDHGRYTVPTNNNSRPGDHFETVSLSYECDAGYELLGHNIVTCHRGSWAPNFPTCTKLCRLNPHPSISHKCYMPGEYSGLRPCNLYERHGTIVTPECNSPNYYHAGVLKIMTCLNGDWDHVPICEPECGRVTPNGVPMQVGGKSAKHGELPWHAGIYDKRSSPYMQICGGSLVSTTMVISAAHCFWNKENNSLASATNYAVGLGKIYRPWPNTHDENRQTFDVSDVKVPTRFRDIETLYQSDIALVFLDRPAVYHHHVRPVCIDFDVNFDRRQLEDGKKGKIAGWGNTKENELAPAQVLQVLELPVVSLSECITRVTSEFRQFITNDKFCAGYWNEGKALCRGDSGGGLAFAESERSMERYYLRGVASTVARNNTAFCNTESVTTFSMISRHEQFIKEYLRI